MTNNFTIDINKFQKYKDNAIEKCKKLSFSEKTQGLWNEPEIIEYFTRIEPEEAVNYIALSIKNLKLNNKKILCIGGGTGSIGRRILAFRPDLYVTEIDSSLEMVSRANKIANEKNITDHFISIKADAISLPFKDNEYGYVIAYSIFRYINNIDQEKVITEIGRVSDNNFTIAESILKDLIYSLKKIVKGKSDVIETQVNMHRVSLFYMLYGEYKINNEFKEIIDDETTKNIDFIDILTNIAGISSGILYELRVCNSEKDK